MEINTTYDTPLVTALERVAPHDYLSLIYENSEDHYGVARRLPIKADDVADWESGVRKVASPRRRPAFLSLILQKAPGASLLEALS